MTSRFPEMLSRLLARDRAVYALDLPRPSCKMHMHMHMHMHTHAHAHAHGSRYEAHLPWRATRAAPTRLSTHSRSRRTRWRWAALGRKPATRRRAATCSAAAGGCNAKSGSGRPPTVADLKPRALSAWTNTPAPAATFRVTKPERRPVPLPHAAQTRRRGACQAAAIAP
eukprot:scaffold7579_cov63-Phaeocystis_antarctica.AAC.2